MFTGLPQVGLYDDPDAFLAPGVTLSARDTDCDPARAVRGVHALR